MTLVIFALTAILISPVMQAFASSNSIYAIGGSEGGSILNTVEAYDPLTNTWTVVAPMHDSRYTLAAATDSSGNIYAIGGQNLGRQLNTVEAYDPLTNTWTVVAPMPAVKWVLAAATDSSGNIYAIGGMDNRFQTTDTVYKYTPSTNSWSSVAPLPTASSQLAAATDSSGNIYAIGGVITAPSSGVVLDTVYKYTPSTNSWSSVAPLPTARYGLAAATDSSGNIYAIGGWDSYSNGQTTDTVYKYTPSTNSWSSVAPLPVRLGHLAAATDSSGNIYAIGGATDRVFKYTPSTNSWSSVAPTHTSRNNLAAASLLGPPVNPPPILQLCELDKKFCNPKLNRLDLLRELFCYDTQILPCGNTIPCPPFCLPVITKETLLDIQQDFPPLQQVKAGIPLKDIVATKGQILITNDHRDYPASVTQKTAEILMSRSGPNWHLP